MRNTDSRRTRILKYVLFSLGAFWLMRPDKVAPHPTHRNRMERTITQDGALYALHHRPTHTVQRDLQKRLRTALVRPFITLTTDVIESTRSTVAAKFQPPTLASIGHFPDVFVYTWRHQRLVDENSAMRSSPMEDGKPVRTELLLPSAISQV